MVLAPAACVLPEPPDLPPVALVDAGCPADLVCMDLTGARALARRLEAEARWRTEVTARCTPASVAPDGGPP